MKNIVCIAIIIIFAGCATSNITSVIKEGIDLAELQNIASEDNVKIETNSIYKGHTLYHCYRRSSLIKLQDGVRFYIITNDKNKIIYMSQYGIRKHDRDFLIDFVEGDTSKDKKQIEIEMR